MAGTTSNRFETLGEILEQLGDIDPARVRATPPPGRATEKDLIRLLDHSGRLYELVDGVLVEKVTGFPESALACDLIHILGTFVEEHDLGFLAGPDGAMRLMPGLVRLPDISFISWKQLPSKERPTDAIADLAPVLAIEVLSEGNTRKEIQRKLREYFLSGVQIVWLVDPKTRTVRVCTAPDELHTLTERDAIDGGEVLPGLNLPIRKVFAGLPAVRKTRRKK